MKTIVFLYGWWRIIWGFCPMCNSDAPELDTCEFCGSFRGWRDKQARSELKYKWSKHNGIVSQDYYP